MQHSTIEWTDATWNPVRGCSRVSEGCRNCYAERIAARFSGPGLTFERFARSTEDGPRWTGEVALVEDRLLEPLRWITPQRIFVNSMSDLFHEKLTFQEIDRVFAIMLQAPRHTFQVLTKRPARMREYFGDGGLGASHRIWRRAGEPGSMEWPLPNVWLGTSVEHQEAAAIRIPELLMTPAVVRFLSVEPLLGPVDLGLWLHGIDWVIVGGESGPGARPMHPAWARAVRDRCQARGVPFFFKQWGAYEPVRALYGGDEKAEEGRGELVPMCTEGHMWPDDLQPPLGSWLMERVGKRSSGRLLDGRTWDEFPLGMRVTLHDIDGEGL
jgi:protein gp37